MQQLKKQKPIQQKTPQNEEEDLWSDIRNLRLIRHHLNRHQSQFLLPLSTITTASQQWPAQFCHEKTTEQNKTKHLTDSFPPSRGTETATVQCVRRCCCCFSFCQCKAQSYKNIIAKGVYKASAALQHSENNGKQRVFRTSFTRG